MEFKVQSIEFVEGIMKSVEGDPWNAFGGMDFRWIAEIVNPPNSIDRFGITG